MASALVERGTAPVAGALTGTGRGVYALGLALATVTAAGTGLTLAVPGVLRGPAVMQGSARGTALVMLVLAVPVLVLAMAATHRGSDRAVVAWLGASAHLVYNAVMLVFGTPFNALFLLYVAVLGLGLATLIGLTRRLDVPHLAARLAPAPVRVVASYVAVVAVANALVWLRVVVPDLSRTRAPAHLQGTGLTTSPLYVQDLAFWLPLAGLAAVLLWRRVPWGYALVGGLLWLWFIEAVGVVADQWFGSRADPASHVGTLGGARLFVAVAVVDLVPMALLLGRHRAPPP